VCSTHKQKHAVAAAITDVLLKFKRSEAFGEVIWVLIEEPRSSQTASDGFSGKSARNRFDPDRISRQRAL
jgi:phenylpyruvate tautomerase PptA (4-oxalocrotonate tautomerase family)